MEGTLGGQERNSHGLLERLPFFTVALIAFLIPFFFIPSSLVSISSSKGVLLFVLVTLAVIFWVLSVLRRGSMSVPRTWLFLALIALALIYFVASIFSGQIASSLVGEGFSIDTFVSVFAGVLLVFIIPASIRTRRDLLSIYVAVIAGFIVVGLVQLVRLFAGPEILTLSVLTTPTASLLGRWNDLGIFSGLILLLSILSLELFYVGKRIRILLYVISAFTLFFLALVQFVAVWYVIGIFFLLLILYKLSVTTRSPSRSFSRETIPALAVAIVIISVIFVVAGGPIQSLLTDYFNTSYVEVRPSLKSTWSVASNVLRESPILGVGPNKFSEAWFLYKPNGVNLSAFWSVPFNLGIGFIPTTLVTSGILGFVGWVIFLGLLLYLGARHIFKNSTDSITQYLIISSFLASVYLWVFSVIYVPGVALFTLAFVFTGLFLAALYQGKSLQSWGFSFSDHALQNFVGALVAVMILIVVGVGGYTTVARFIGGVLHQQGLVLARAGDIDAGERSVTRALQFSEQALFYRTLAEIQTAQLAVVLSRSDVGPDVLRNQFQSVLSNAVTSAQQSTIVNSNDYRNWLTLGRLYEEIVPLGVDGAYDRSFSAYERAQVGNPQGADISLALARLEVRNGNNETARERIAEALAKKSNYTDAIFLLAQIEVAEGNLASAIRSVEAAVIIEPNNPTVFFQLGILRYSNNDFSGSASAFEAAVGLNQSYANARYFLGLSYDLLGRRSDAIIQFEQVQALNPDNAEVEFILTNLRNDQTPFANVQPPLDDEPESRPELPADEPIVDVEVDDETE